MRFIEDIIGSRDLGAQFASFGWSVKSCDGHSTEKAKKALLGE
jgi:transketolase N-terminal domain/subunit